MCWLRISRSSRPSSPLATSVDVRRAGPQSDLGKLWQGLGRLTGRATTASGHPERFVYRDPEGIFDAPLRSRVETWPSARHGDGVVRPAELSAIRVTREGLVVESTGWWGSGAALDHQLGLALDLAERLTPAR